MRHGQTEANAAQVMAGSTDSPLTELGRQQAEAALTIVESLEIKPEIIVHSHLSRARDTANIINATLRLPIIEEPDFAEIHAGELEGTSYEACCDLLENWDMPPDGESLSAFTERIRRGKKNLLSREEKSPLIISHGGIFRGLAHLYEIDIPGVPNCKLYEFDPHTKEADFPWSVHTYEPDKNGKIRKKKISFHNLNWF